MAPLLGDMAQFVHGSATLPPSMQTALAHVQLKTMHPFFDGNGRISRLQIAALFRHFGLLPELLM